MDYLWHILIMAQINMILVVSFNILLGFTGIFALCHAAFYGIGAYTVALLMKTVGFTFLPALICAIIITSLCSLLIAIPGLRVHWDYMVIFAFSFQMVIYHLMMNWMDLTRGPQGIAGIPIATIFGFEIESKPEIFLLCFILCLFVVYISWKIENSSFGLVLKGIKDDPIAVKSIGKNVTNHKIVAFSIASGLAAIAGSLIAVYISYISPGYFDLHVSVFIVIALIFGGLGNIGGAVLGAFILTILPELLRFIPNIPSTILGGTRDLIYASILAVFILYRPSGIFGKNR